MSNNKSARQKAIIRRRIFLSLCALVLALIIALVTFIVVAIAKGGDDKNENSSVISSEISEEDTSSNKDNANSQASNTNLDPNFDKDENSSVISSETSKEDTSSNKDNTNSQASNTNLDPNFECLLLVNGKNPLPDTYDSEVRASLVEIDKQYRNNNYVTQIHKDVYPYITAMVKKANEEGVNLKVWSPFRSYAIQKDLFQKQVNRVGGNEEKAATVVARPGTSEHNTGLCADFNMASDAFENTEMYRWMKENAEDYGFIMRYSAEKQPITGVIHESWHWRFVGINAAKEINRLGMCLEEYVEYKNK